MVRLYQPQDLDAIRKIHKSSGLDYQMPNLDSPLFLSKIVVEREGQPTTLLAGRIEVEAYLVTSGKPRERWEDIQLAQGAFLEDLWAKGIDNAMCSVPPEVDRHFAKRMTSLGWEPQRVGWRNWYRATGA
jgi:hypothetical protein